MTDQTPTLAEAQLAQAVAALSRLSLIDEMAGMGQRDGDPELKARCAHAAGTLETIQRLADEAPEPVTEPLTHFTTAGDSRLAADNFPVCEAAHWAIVSPEVRHVTCENCMEWLSAAVTNLTKALANAAATIERRDAEPEPEPPLPPGKYGRVELPGRREHVGFIAEEIRFGQQCAVVRDWNGAEIACAYGGPGAVVVWLPQPLKRPEVRQPQQRAIGYGFYEDDDDNPWGGDGDDD